MESYGRFAGVYDVFMDNVNYREWADYIIETLAQDGIRDGLVLELGCGTGTVTEMLADAGYDMIGIDNSEEMLAEAMEKRAESGHDILYLLQDMQDFELYGTVRAVISVCDSMNYLTDEEDLDMPFDSLTFRQKNQTSILNSEVRSWNHLLQKDDNPATAFLKRSGCKTDQQKGNKVL